MRGFRPFAKWRFGARTAAALFGPATRVEREAGVEARYPVPPDRPEGPAREEVVDELSLILYSDLAEVLRVRRGEPVGDSVTGGGAGNPRPEGSAAQPRARRPRPTTSRAANRRPCRRSSSLR